MAKKALKTKKAIRVINDPSPTDNIHDTIEIDRKTYFRTSGRIVKYREYAEGRQRMTVPEGAKQLLDGVIDDDFEFCDNVCHKIIFEAANRIELLRFECATDEGVSAFLEEFFTKCNVKDFSAETHYQTLRDGDYGVSLDWDEDREYICLSRELWFDGQSGIYIGYDVQGHALYAVKDWQTIEGVRRLVWYDDRLERWIGLAGIWEPFVLPSDKSVWPQPWEKVNGDPLHMPVVHFPNTIRGTTNYGSSEISGGVTGFQDLINDSHYDEAAAARMTGFQQMYISGYSIPRLPNGDPDPDKVPTAGPGQVWISENHETKFGVLAAGSIDAIVTHRTELKKSVSNMTSTPFHTITGGDWPSGEALLRAEKPAVDKALRQILKFAVKWIEVAHRAIEIANAFGGYALNEDALISVVFASPERRDPVSMSTSVRNLAGFISIREANRMMGKTPQEADLVWEEIKEEKTDLGAALLDSFDKGQNTGTPPPENNNGTNTNDKTDTGKNDQKDNQNDQNS